MGVLLQILQPQKGESLKSFLLRLTMENHYDTISWIYELSNLTRRSPYFLSPRNNDLINLSDLVRMPCDELWNLTFVNEFDDYLSDNYYTQLIYKYGIISKHSRICPVCIAENKYEKKIWDLKINLVCQKHKILLINECSKCNDFIWSNRDSIQYCNCGFPLGELPKIQAHKYLIEIANLLHHSPKKKSTSASSNYNPLYNLSLKHIVSLLTFFSRQLTIYFDYVKFSNNTSTRNNNYQQLIMDAFQIFMDWPHNYYSFLNDIRNSRLEQKGSKLQLSGIYIGIHRKFISPEFSFLRDEFYNFMRDDKSRNYRIVRSKISLKEESNFLNFKEVTKILKMKPNTVKILVKNGFLEGTYKDFPGHEQVLIPKESIDKYHKLVETNLSLKEVASFLGINTRKVVELQKHGLIQALLGPEVGAEKWLFSKDSVHSLLTNLIQVEVNGNVISVEVINFSQASRLASSYGLKVGDFINLLLKHEIIPHHIQNQNIGLNQLLFEKPVVEKSIKKWKSLNDCELNALEISRIIGENYDYVLLWLNAGLIKSNRENQGKNNVHNKDLLNFQKKYISLKQLSIKLNIHSTKLRRLLLNQNIKPIIGSKLDGGYLYLIRDVLKFRQFSR